MFQSLAGLEPLDLLPDGGRGTLRVNIGGEMRRHQDPRVTPEGVAYRQRLGVEDVKARPAELPGIQRLQQVCLVELCPAPDIDHPRPWRQMPEEIGIEDALRLGGEREQADQDIQPVEEGRDLVTA